MFAGGTVNSNRGQNAAEQIKLIRDKRIDLREIAAARVELFLRAVSKKNQIFDNRFLLIVIERQRLRSGLCLLQNSFANNLVHIG